MKKWYWYLLLLVVACSCMYKKTDPVIVCATPEIVSFSRDIQPIFDNHCNTAGCHSGNNPAGNLNLEAAVAYAQLNKTGSGYIDTLNPNYSVLYASMIASSNPMPPTGKLDKCTLDLVLKWIQQKAKNN